MPSVMLTNVVWAEPAPNRHPQLLIKVEPTVPDEDVPATAKANAEAKFGSTIVSCDVTTS